jgi:hypothetical protein
MPFDIRIEPGTRIAIAACSGDLGFDDAKEGAAALWAHPGWGGAAVVWDFRAARLEMSTPQIKEIARFILEGQPSTPPARVAFVTERDHDFGLLRMFDVYREHASTLVRVFRDLDEAVPWARSAEGPGR